MPTMPYSFFLLLILLAVPFTSMRACHGRLLRDHHEIQPENQATAVIQGKHVIDQSNSLKREYWRTSGGAATTKSLKDKKTLTSTKQAEENQEAVKKTVLSGAVRNQSTHVSVSWRIPRMEKHKQQGRHPGSMDVLAPSPHHAVGYTETSESMVLSDQEQSEHETIEHDLEGTVTMNDSLSMDYQMPHRGPSIHNK